MSQCPLASGVEEDAGVGGVDALEVLEVFSRTGLGTGPLSGALARMRDMDLGCVWSPGLQMRWCRSQSLC